MLGDCSNCNHSLMYHVPLIGCMKCGCGEFSIRIRSILRRITKKSA